MSNGKDLGQTPVVIEEVKPGDVMYELRLSGYKSGSVSGKVEPQQQTFLAARLEKSAGPAPGQPFTNSLGMRFVPLGDVQISIWETRVQDYEAFCHATARQYEPPDFHQTPTDPAVKVSWFDAVAFCKWLTEKEHNENLIGDREAYRLPTDPEWSTAVGLVNESGPTPETRDGKIKNEFPWGKQWPPPNDAGNFAGTSGRRRTATLPVGSFKSNSIGLYDIGGNVWEWCLDTYKGDDSAAGRDWGVLRGGSWATRNRLEMQSSYRNVVDRNERDVIYGFRCVLAPRPGGDVKDQ
jgi:formylglycine-generating enzyme required for sulfatase activity